MREDLMPADRLSATALPPQTSWVQAVQTEVQREVSKSALYARAIRTQAAGELTHHALCELVRILQEEGCLDEAGLRRLVRQQLSQEELTRWLQSRPAVEAMQTGLYPQAVEALWPQERLEQFLQNLLHHLNGASDS